MGYSFLLSPILTAVSNKLGDYVVGKIIEHCNLEGEVQCLKMFLNEAQCNFRNAESDFSLLDTDDEFLESMSEIRKILCQAEDALDTFNCNIDRITSDHEELKMALGNASIHPKKLVPNRVSKCIEKVKELKEANRLCESIKLIYMKLDTISKRNNIFNFTKPEIKKYENRYKNICNIRERSLKMDDKYIVGFTEEKKKIEELLHGRKDTRRLVIPVVGMGGSGKTTIAYQLYRAAEKKNLFDVYVCVNVAKTNSTYEEQTDKFVKAIKAALNTKVDQDELNDIRKILAKKRYLILLDDVWDIDSWEMISQYFPKNNNGSRLLITTRSMRVARIAGSKETLVKLNPLDDHDSMQLLKSAYSCEDFPDEQRDELNSMLMSCYGLPLGILELGKKLCCREYHNWREVKKYGDKQQNEIKGIKWNVDSNSCLQIVGLSYNDLEPKWKPCFLYLSAFPKNTKIDVNKLIRLWIAEGFIIPEDDTELEDTAMAYLHELIDRNMVQEVGETTEFVKIHGMLLDLCLLKAKQVLFASLDGGKFHMKPEIVRRIALHNCMNIKKCLDDETVKFLRTLLCFVPFTYDFKKFQLLRVLHLSGKKISELPDQIDDLIQLRYLGLSGDGTPASSPSTGVLTSSQMLDEKCIFWRKLQAANLPYLHTLYLERVVDMMDITFSKNSFPKLKVLILKSLENTGSLLVENGAMNSLRLLRLKRCRELEILCPEEGALKKLRCLEVEDCDKVRMPLKLRNRSDITIKGYVQPTENEPRTQICGTSASNCQGQELGSDKNSNQINTGVANANNKDAMDIDN